MVESGQHHSEAVWNPGALLILLGHGLGNFCGYPGINLTCLNATSEAAGLDRRGTFFFPALVISAPVWHKLNLQRKGT